MTEERKWNGPELLRRYLVPIGSLSLPDPPAGNPQVKEGLEARGQTRPILTGSDERTVVGRAHLLVAARELGWTHVAARLDAAEKAAAGAEDQMSLVAEVEAKGSDHVEAWAAPEKEKDWRETSEADVDRINEATADPEAQWVGLPEFIPVDEAHKLVISCSTEEDREALLDALGIATIHKGTRGTLSVWWPDRKKKDLSSIRFEIKADQ
jgi:hypothetical protein